MFNKISQFYKYPAPVLGKQDNQLTSTLVHLKLSYLKILSNINQIKTFTFFKFKYKS